MFQSRFQVVDDFLGDDVRYTLRKTAPDTFISSHAGALIQEWQWSNIGGQVSGEALAVLLGLDFHADEGHAFFLGFDDAGCLAAHIEEIIRKAVPAHEGKISEDHASPSMKIRLCSPELASQPVPTPGRCARALDLRELAWGAEYPFPLEKAPHSLGEVLSAESQDKEGKHAFRPRGTPATGKVCLVCLVGLVYLVCVVGRTGNPTSETKKTRKTRQTKECVATLWECVMFC